MLTEQQFNFFSYIQTSQTGGQLYSDTLAYDESSLRWLYKIGYSSLETKSYFCEIANLKATSFLIESQVCEFLIQNRKFGDKK